MKVVVCGVTPGGLTACTALSREGHDVVLIGSHEADAPEYLHGDLGVLERRGLFGELPVEDLGAVPLLRSQFLFSDGADVSGFTTDVTGDTPVLVQRRNVVGWLRKRLSETDVRDRSQAKAGALIRRENVVRGVWTDEGPFEADVVYLAEGNFSWLTRQEGYHRTYPGENPNYILNVSKQYSTAEFTGPVLQPGPRNISTRGTVTRLVPPPYPSNPSLNGVLRLTGGKDQLFANVMVPYEQFRKTGTSVQKLVNWAEALPLFEEFTESQESSSPETSLVLPGGHSEWPPLCDHGLALGGEGSGTSLLFPEEDSLGVPLHSAHQFSRALSHLERSGKKASREFLRSYYVRPLQESSHGRRAKRSDPWIKFLLETGDTTLSRAAAGLATGELSPDWNLRNLVETLKELQPDSWSLSSLQSTTAFGQDLYRQLSASIAKDADDFVFTAGDPGWGTRILLRLLRRGMTGEVDNSSADRPFPTYLLKTIGSVTSWLSGPSGHTQPNSDTGEKESGPRPVHGTGPNVLTTVESSLNEGVHKYRALEVACPHDVFDLEDDSKRRDFNRSPEHCTECGICRFGEPRIDFVDDFSPDRNSERNQESAEDVLGTLYGRVPSDLPEPIRIVLRKARARFRSAERTLASSSFLTPDARRWIQGQLNLVRSAVREQEFPGDFQLYRQEFLALLDRIRRVLSRQQYRFAQQLLQQGVQLYLPLPGSANTAEEVSRREPEELASGDGNDEWLGDQVRRFVERLDERFRERVGSPRGAMRKRSVALVVPGEKNELVGVVTPEVEELVVAQEGGFWTLTPRDLTPGRSLDLSEGLRVRRYELSTGTTRRSPDLDYRKSLEPFADLLLDLQEGLRSNLSSILGPDGTVRGRATGPDEVLPIAYLEALGTPINRTRSSPSESFDQTLMDLFSRQELLLGSDFGCLESMVHLREERDSSRESLDEIASLLELLVGTLPEFSNELFARDLTKVDGSDPLGLSPEQRERWEEGDTGGIVDDSVRQWRTALGELRQLTDDQQAAPEEVGVFSARLWQTRDLIDHVQRRLRSGGSPRRESLLLDLAMRRVFRSRQPLGPVSRHPLRSSGESTASFSGKPPLKKTLDRLEDRFGERSTGKQFIPVEGLYSSLFQSLRDSEKNIASSSVQRIIVLLAEADSLIETLGHRESASKTLLLGRLLRLHSHLGHFLSSQTDLLARSSGNSPSDLRRRTTARLRQQFTEGIYENSFKRRVRGLTDRFRQELPITPDYFDEGTERGSLERALEFFSPPLSRCLQNRTNLHSLYDQYVRLIAELLRLEEDPDRRPGDTNYDEWVRVKLFHRSQNVLRSTSSLFIHGARDIRDEIEPPEAQVLDLLEPESIFARRYRSIG